MGNIDALDLINKGGLLIWPILLCSLAGTTIFFERLLRYRKFLKQHQNPDTIFQLIHDGKFDKARHALHKSNPDRSAAKHIMLEALTVDEPDRETVEMILVHGVEREIATLSQYLSTLAVLGSTAPLLGLLGTVIGMIKALYCSRKHGWRGQCISSRRRQLGSHAHHRLWLVGCDTVIVFSQSPGKPAAYDPSKPGRSGYRFYESMVQRSQSRSLILCCDFPCSCPS